MQRMILKIEDGVHSVEIPYYILGDLESHKSIFFSGGVHGDEINGVLAAKIALDVVKNYEDENKLDGKVIVIPVMNPSGFYLGKRVVSFDGKDLNRSFGKDITQNFSDLIAQKITEEIFMKTNMGVDFHDAGEGSILLPHVRIHIDDQHDCISCSRELGGYFGSKYILERKGNPHMLAVALKRSYNIPVITVEMGGDQYLEPGLEESISRGVRNMLIATGMVDEKPEIPEETYVINKRVILQSKYAGVLHLDVDIGDKVIEGEEIGNLYDPVSDRNLTIRSPKKGLIFSRWPNNLMPSGRTIISVVCFESNDAVTEVDMGDFAVKPYLI